MLCLPDVLLFSGSDLKSGTKGTSMTTETRRTTFVKSLRVLYGERGEDGSDPDLVCSLCGQRMPSKNALFRHLKSSGNECGRC
jgi:hypothetical protein